MPESLYIHIPFCLKKCLYCDFFSVPYDESLAKTYTNALCKELILKKDHAAVLSTIYIGGGTPSLLPEACFIELFRCLRDNFDLSPSAEITVEANPGTLNESKVGTIISLGVNRMSVGVQSLDDLELKKLGRIHTAEDAFRSIDLIKKAGFKNLSLDFMYGIPGQTIGSWRDTLSMAIASSPTHISAYELTPEEKTPLFGLIKSGEMIMPDEELILEMYNHAVDCLGGSGYKHYEISNFALPGFICIHNMNYWDRGEYVGAGAGAHSFVGGVRSRNIKNIRDYISHTDMGMIPEAESAKVTLLEVLKECIFLGLRKMHGISIEQAEKQGLDILSACEEMIRADYLAIEGGMVRLTRKGIPLSNAVITKIFETAGL